MEAQEPQLGTVARTYDSSANFRINLSIERKGKTFNVAHVLAPVSDVDIITYERERRVTVTDANKSELGENGTVIEADNFKASVALWDRKAFALEGYKTKTGADINSLDWKNLIKSDDKFAAVTEGLLAAEILPSEAADESDELFIDDDADDFGTVKLRCLANDGEEIVTTHRLKTPSAETISRFRGLNQRSYFVGGSRFGQSAKRVPGKSKALGQFYDQLIIETERYAGSVPLHHKAIVIENYLSSSAGINAKN